MKFFLKSICVATLVIYFCSSAYANIGEDLASPVTTPARTYFWVGSAATIGLVLFKRSIDKPFHDHLVSSRPLGGLDSVGDHYGRMFTNLTYVAGMGLAQLVGIGGAWQHGKVMLLATVYSSAVTVALKRTVRGIRPDYSQHSFPSGHTTTAFAFASVVGAEHGLAYAIPVYSLAAITGLSRMNMNRHYLRDVIGGMTIGVSYGLGMHYLYGKKGSESAAAQDDARKNAAYALLPIEDGALLMTEFSF